MLPYSSITAQYVNISQELFSSQPQWASIRIDIISSVIKEVSYQAKLNFPCVVLAATTQYCQQIQPLDMYICLGG